MPASRQAVNFGSNQQRSNPLDGARLVNLFAEKLPLGSRAPGFLATEQSQQLKVALYGTPGLKAFAMAGNGTIRAMRYALNYLWVLSGAQVYRVDSTGAATLCTGAAIPVTGNAMITDNGVQVAVLSGGLSYVIGIQLATCVFTVTGGTYVAGTNQVTGITVNAVAIMSAAVNWSTSNEQTAADIAANINANVSVPDYTASVIGATLTISAAAGSGVGPNGFAVVVTPSGDVSIDRPNGTMSGGTAGGAATTITQVTATGYPTAGASSMDFIDGYTIWSQANSAQWFLSSLYNTSAVSALDFATAQSTSDIIVRIIVAFNEVWIFKTNSTEVWTDTGESPFPFRRIPGSLLDRGCRSAMSPAKLDNSLFWLGDDLIVYHATSYLPVRISTHGIEEIIRASYNLDAYGFAYSQGGHAFYVLTLPTAGRTLVYDTVVGGWHERQSGTSIAPAAWSPTCIVSAFGNLYVGTVGGQVCQLDMDTFTEAGAAIRRAAITPPFYPAGKLGSMSKVEVECELGVGINTGQGSNPTMMLRWSDDGGRTWSNQRTQSMGLTGDATDRAIFRRMGQFRQREIEISISDPVKVAIYGLNIEMGQATT